MIGSGHHWPTISDATAIDNSAFSIEESNPLPTALRESKYGMNASFLFQNGNDSLLPLGGDDGQFHPPLYDVKHGVRTMSTGGESVYDPVLGKAITRLKILLNNYSGNAMRRIAASDRLRKSA